MTKSGPGQRSGLSFGVRMVSGWKEIVEKHRGALGLAPPASLPELEAAEAKLGGFPDGLRGLLLQSNGVRDRIGYRIVWPIEEIVKQNVLFRGNPDFRELYMTFDSLLFFGEFGNGDQFAYAVHADGKVRNPDILVWDHETDERLWMAADLARFLERAVHDTLDHHVYDRLGRRLA